jgi:adenylate cyclase
MGVHATVVFTDLHGSTAAFEALGNARATEAVTHITNTISKQFEQHGGRVIKKLGDGVLALFNDGQSAVRAVVDLQRYHSKLKVRGPAVQFLPIRIGLASGDVELVDNDCYGDAVNVAARLCDLCGPNQIWANAMSLNAVDEAYGVNFRILGPINIRGRAEPCVVYQIEWHEEEPSDFLTMHGSLDGGSQAPESDILGREIELGWVGSVKRFRSFELPIRVGRVRTVEFMVNDPRVSRTHARLEWRNGGVVLIDISSYGTWVRFLGVNGADILLRREECVLHGEGALALGGSFADSTAPTITFRIC